MRFCQPCKLRQPRRPTCALTRCPQVLFAGLRSDVLHSAGGGESLTVPDQGPVKSATCILVIEESSAETDSLLDLRPSSVHHDFRLRRELSTTDRSTRVSHTLAVNTYKDAWSALTHTPSGFGKRCISLALLKPLLRPSRACGLVVVEDSRSGATKSPKFENWRVGR